MKKIFLALLWIVSIANLQAQGTTCATAISLINNDCLENNTIGGTVLWFSFVPNDTSKRIEVRTQGSWIGKASKIYLYSGTCTSLSLIDSATSGATDSIFGIDALVLTKTATYYIKINPLSGYHPVIDVCLSPLSDDDIFCSMGPLPVTNPTPPVCELICNGNFESHWDDPYDFGQISVAECWNKIEDPFGLPGEYICYTPNPGTPDYFNNSYTPVTGFCASVDVPVNTKGTEPSHISGDGYGGFYTYIKENLASSWLDPLDPQHNYREYIQQKLAAPLVPGATYTVSMYVSLADYSAVATPIGILFSSNALFALPIGPLPFTPQLETPTMITQTNGWTAVTFSYTVPVGTNYQWIIIGNFRADAAAYINVFSPSTTMLSYAGCIPKTIKAAYYYIDDVSITPVPFTITASPSSICAGQPSTLSSPTNPNQVYNWTPSGTVSCTTCSTTVATPAVNTTYTASVTYAPGCTLTATTSVAVTAPPSITSSEPNLTYCSGISVPLNSFIGSSHSVTFSWTNSNTAIGLAASGTGSVPAFTAINTSGSPITSTITVTPVLGSCTGTPVIYTITVNPTPVMSAVTSISRCSGTVVPATTFSSTVAGTTYSWTNSNTAIGLAAAGTGNLPAFTAANATGSPISGTITVTPTAGTCAGAPITFTITVNPVPAPSVSPSAPTIISGGSVGLSVTPSSGMTYSWLPVTGLSCANCYNPTASPTATTTYTVSVSNSTTGCSATTTVTVTVIPPQCNITADYTVPPAGANASAIIAFFGGSNQIVTKNIFVQGTLTIDTYIEFNGCNMVMSANTKIDLTTGNLHLAENTHIFTCGNYLWDGIYIPNGRILTVNYAFIEDAINAVTSVNGGDFDLYRGLFNKNLKAVDVRAYSAGVHPGDIRNCIFTSRAIPSTATTSTNPTVVSITSGGLLPTYASATIKPPGSALKGYYGVYAKDVTAGLSIGNPAAAGNINVFDNLMCGIDLENSTAIILNNTFQNLLGYSGLTSCPGGSVYCSYQPGIGVYASGTGNYILVGATGSPVLGNTFTNTYRAIFISQYATINIANNVITNSGTGPFGTTLAPLINYGDAGIYLKPASNNDINVSENIITNCKEGVWINRGTSTSINSISVLVENNTINANSSGYCTDGVLLADVSNSGSTTPTDKIKVRNNTITEAFNCVSATNVKNSLVIYNNPVLHVRNDGTNAGNGIKLSNCKYARIHNNSDIDLVPAASPVTATNIMYKGIFVTTSPNCEITCNTIKNMGESMCFTGLSGASTLRNNTMTAGNRGLVLRSNGEIGAQGSSMLPCGLWWPSAGSTFAAHTYTDGTTNANTNSKLYVNNTGAPVGYTGIPTINLALIGSVAYTTGSPFGINAASGSPINCNSIVVMLVAPGGDEESLSPEDLHAFANDKFEYPVFEEENQYQHQKLAFEEIEAVPSVTTAEPELQSFYDSASVAALGLLKEVDLAILDSNHLLAVTLNNSVVPVNMIETNQQQFNELYLLRLADESHAYSEIEKEALYGIANQCPLEGGNAVWQARVLIWDLENTPVEFIDNCTTAERRSSTVANKAQENTSGDFNLYPNPNNGEMILTYHLEESGTMAIYDLTGKRITQYALSSKNNKLNINEHSLQAGVYFYTIAVNNKIVKQDKLVIIK